jgi:hypothetical protein
VEPVEFGFTASPNPLTNQINVNLQANQTCYPGITNTGFPEFDVFITVDRNLSFQQNLSQFNIAVVVLQASSNRLIDLKPLVPKILDILSTLVKGQAVVVSLE